MSNINVFKEASQLRRNKTDFFVSNIYCNPDRIDQIEQNDNALAYGYDDKGVFRVYFAANDADALCDILKKFPKSSGIEIIGAELDERLEKALDDAEFESFAVYLRATIHNMKEDIYKNLPEKYQDVDCWSYVQYAEPEHAQEIYDMLYGTFKPLTSHLQNMDELLEDIKNKQVVVALEDGHVLGFMTYEYQGKKLYMEHAINNGPSILMHAIYMALLEKALEDGINVTYTWMRDDNSRVLAFARRYGYEIDNVKNFVFEKK